MVAGAPMVGLALVPPESMDPTRRLAPAFGMRGSGSNTIQIENAVVPDHYVVEGNILATDFSGDTVEYDSMAIPCMQVTLPATYSSRSVLFSSEQRRQH